MGFIAQIAYCFWKKKEESKGKHQELGVFVSRSYSNLKKAIESFKKHEATKYHKESVEKRFAVEKQVQGKIESIDKQIDSQKKREVKDNRKPLIPIVETIRFCSKQNISLHGHHYSGRIELS